MNVEKAVGLELSACRRKKRMSQERLGFDAGVHRTYVSLIERGVKSPGLSLQTRLERHPNNVFHNQSWAREVANERAARRQ